MDADLALDQDQLQHPVSQCAEEQQAVGVPRAELEPYGDHVVFPPSRQLQEAGGVEEDGKGVGLHTGEAQVALRREKRRQRVLRVPVLCQCFCTVNHSHTCP